MKHPLQLILSVLLAAGFAPAQTLDTVMSLNQKHEALIKLAEAIENHGLAKKWYVNDSTEKVINAMISNENLESASKEITSAVQDIKADLSIGRVTPDLVEEQVKIKKKSVPTDNLIQKYLDGQMRVEDFITSASSKNPLYLSTLKTYQYLRSKKLDNTWLNVPQGLSLSKLELGNTSKAVSYLRAKLNELGYTNNSLESSFDEELQSVVKDFQKLNNLESDGIVGPISWKYLNRPLEELRTQAVINLNKLRWLPDSFEAEHIFVNLAVQNFKFYQNHQLVMNFKTINGRTDRQTPIMIDQVKSVVLNPTWTVPFNIMINDKLPELQKDPGFANRLHMKVIDDVTGKVVDPYSIDWTKQSAENLQYTLVQKPGPWNALGFIKFPLTNPYAIYLHDTDSRHLFKQTPRLFSSGCVRLEFPFDFGEKMLNSPKWTAQSIKDATEFSPAQAEDPTTIKMDRKVAVYLFHMTLFAENGKIATIPDAYELDSEIFRLMN